MTDILPQHIRSRDVSLSDPLISCLSSISTVVLLQYLQSQSSQSSWICFFTKHILLPLFQYIGRFDFSKFIYFAMYINICYIQVHSKYCKSRKAKIIYILERRELYIHAHSPLLNVAMLAHSPIENVTIHTILFKHLEGIHLTDLEDH